MAIPTLASQSYVDGIAGNKLDLAGGTMTGGLTLSASGIIFSDATYLTTAPAGSTLAADQLTAGVVTANPTSGPTASGDVLQYNGSALVWAAGGGGGGVAWGAITGTLSDQTDLASALSAKLDSSTAASTYQPKSALNSITSGSTYNVVTSDAGGVVYLDPALSGGLTTVYLPDGTTGYDVANGQSIRFINRSGAFTPVAFATYGSGFPTIYGPGATSGVADGFSVVATKISGYDWFIE